MSSVVTRRRRRVILVTITVLLIVWLAAASLIALSAKRDGQSGADLLQQIRGKTAPAQLLRGAATKNLVVAERELQSAVDGFHSPVLAPVQILPVVGRQLRTAQRVADSASEVTKIVLRATRQATALTHDGASGPANRLVTATRLAAIAKDASEHLRRVDSVENETSLIGAVARARNRFASELHKLRTSLRDVELAASGLVTFLRGPTHYLVFAANNAEMRAGSGMLLTVGVMTVQDGSFSLGTMQQTSDITLPDLRVPIVDADFAARWGWAHPNREWRNLLLSPNFPASAELARAMWQSLTGQVVDGVLVLDPFALRALLQTTGPVDVDGRTITADNVVDEVLHRQYLDIPDEPAAQASRHERLSPIAQAAVGALDRGGWSSPTLLENLQGAAEGRHVMAWSPVPALERGWTAAGIDGRLSSDSLLAAVINTGANKLDQFLAVKGNIAVHRGATTTRVEVTIDLENTTPLGEPSYVGGSGVVIEEGGYKGLVSLDVPKLIRHLDVSGGPPLAAIGRDGAGYVAAAPINIRRGEKTSVTFNFDLPARQRTLDVASSARTPAISWTYEGRTWTDEASKQIKLP